MRTPFDDITIAIAGAEDLPVLRAMLYEAAYWRPGLERPTLDVCSTHPELRKWLQDWASRTGDAGVVAKSLDGSAIGAAWYRFWSEDWHSYGYVGPEVPELAIGVDAKWRGQGLGTKLMTGLLLTASRESIRRVSLSVERDNPALRLYRRFGFHEVGTVGNALTMVADVPDLELGKYDFGSG